MKKILEYLTPWKTIHLGPSIHTYKEHARTGQRRVLIGGEGYQPVDFKWLSDGQGSYIIDRLG